MAKSKSKSKSPSNDGRTKKQIVAEACHFLASRGDAGLGDVEYFAGIDCSPTHFSVVVVDRSGILRGALLLAPQVPPPAQIPPWCQVAVLPVWYKDLRKGVGDDVANAARMELVSTAISFVRAWLAAFAAPAGAICACMEDFAYREHTGAYDIGGIAYLMRVALLSVPGLRLRLHDPGTLKVFLGVSPSAMKPQVAERVVTRWGVDWPRLVDSDKSIWSDVVDAYVAAQVVRVEWLVRMGITGIGELPEPERKMLNRVTKARPVNVLARPWIQGLPASGEFSLQSVGAVR